MKITPIIFTFTLKLFVLVDADYSFKFEAHEKIINIA